MFPKSGEMVKSRRALSKVLPPRRHRGLLVPEDSWNHPSPAGQICFQEQLSQRRDIPVIPGGCSKHLSHPSLWFCSTTEGGRRRNPAWISRIRCANTKPWPGLEPKQARGVYNQQQKQGTTQAAPPLLSCSLDTSPWGNPAFPDSSTRKRGFKRTWRFLPLHLPQKGPLSKHGGVLKTSLNPSI